MTTKSSSAFTLALYRRAIRAFPAHSLTNRRTVRALRERWIAAVLHLGPRWRANPATRAELGLEP